MILSWREILREYELESGIYKGLIEIASKKAEITKSMNRQETDNSQNSLKTLGHCDLLLAGVDECTDSLKEMREILLDPDVTPGISELFAGAISRTADTANEYFKIINSYDEDGIKL
ncbi:MAG TPA: hypothetical protein DCP90_07045 [Clostridiales bacterium]|nr:MAG: hypothetical protein A2Y22_02325 [Clostridiales bacterium GWD2_32_59]HAN10352.1 hypothetical protein [Clostridiales bacterium]